MKILYLLPIALYGVSAFPDFGNYKHKGMSKREAMPHPAWEEIADLLPWEDLVTSDVAMKAKRGTPSAPGSTPAKIVSENEKNCGVVPCNVFNAQDQLVQVHGAHAYASPATDEIRGPCPGLNAAANHAYLPRSGISNAGATVTGLMEAYNFGPTFAAALNVFSSIIAGDILTQQWSIGGPMPFTKLPGHPFEPPQGISFSHNRYEGDVSIGREDAFINDGDAHSLNVTRFMRAYKTSFPDNRFTLDKFRKAFQANQEWSIRHNPEYFSPPLAGLVVAGGAYYFVINFMSNHSEAEPNGYLDRYNIGKFFGLRGKYPNLRWAKGQERIPENWYRRSSTSPYEAQNFAAEFPITFAAYPRSFKVGGNTGKVNSFEGVDIDKLSGGKFKNQAQLTKGNNLACFAFQAQEIAIPDELRGETNRLVKAEKAFKTAFGPIFKKLKCGRLEKYDGSLFQHFKGYHYNPKGGDTNY